MNQSIQYFRVIGFLAVCFIHVNAYGLFGEGYKGVGFVVDEMGRFAVPVFFMIAGFFFKDEMFESPGKYFVFLGWRLLLPTFTWIVIYFCLDMSGVFSERIFVGGVKAYLAVPFTGGAGTHLWFLPALFIGTALCVAGTRVFGSKRFLFITLLLYFVGVGLGAYQKQLGWQVQSVFYRNGLLFAPLFLMSGYVFCRNGIRTNITGALGITIVGALLHLYEGTLTQRFPMGHDYSVGTVLFSVGVFLLVLGVPSRKSWISDLGASVLDGYLVHLVVIRILAELTTWRGPLSAASVALITWVLSLAFAKLVQPSRRIGMLAPRLLGLVVPSRT